jgi:hypothetical protein
MTLVLPGVSLARGGASVGRVELAFVEAVDVSRGTLVVAGETYRVDRRSRLAGADGEPIGLSELKLPDGVILGDRVEMDVSVGDGRRRLVRSLRVLSEPLP